jgi:hypothetical protein
MPLTKEPNLAPREQACTNNFLGGMEDPFHQKDAFSHPKKLALNPSESLFQLPRHSGWPEERRGDICKQKICKEK